MGQNFQGCRKYSSFNRQHYFLKIGLEFEEPSLTLTEKVIERKTGIGEKLTLNLPDGTSIVLNGNSSVIFLLALGIKIDLWS